MAMGFPKGFVWGAAASSYQIEGAPREDGKGQSTWDMLCRKPGAIWYGQNAEMACDHYHRYEEDVALMKQIGLQAYRLSVAWPRVLPEGTGKANEKGLAFYDRLVDELLAAKVAPYVTLFHWDYPYELYCRGGWLSPDSPRWFAEYTEAVVKKLSDRVTVWMTLNEPQCMVGLGMQDGVQAPGLKMALQDVLRAGHNVLLAHGRSVQAIRANAKSKPTVGYAPVGSVYVPASDDPKDVDAARKLMFSVVTKNCWNNTWWMDPVFLGRYPEDGLKLFADDLPPIRSGDMETINQPMDFLGVNIYGGTPARAGADGKPETAPFKPGHPMTAFKWFVVPEAMYWGPHNYWERYRKPIIITENGMSGTDWVALDGKVHDPARIDFLSRYLRQLRLAIDEGADVRGYLQWSLTDNFEWAEGYKERFGLIHVDFVTQKRTLKDSALWYKDVIATNGASILI